MRSACTGARGAGICRARRRDGPHRRDRGHARQGLSACSAATSPARTSWSTRCAPMRRASSSPPRCRPASRPRPCASIRHLKTSSAEREAQQRQIAVTREPLAAAGLPLMPSETQIIPILVGDPESCKAASDRLLDRHGIYIQPINYPTVPRGTERLRITATPFHDRRADRRARRRAGGDVERARPAARRPGDAWSMSPAARRSSPPPAARPAPPQAPSRFSGLRASQRARSGTATAQRQEAHDVVRGDIGRIDIHLKGEHGQRLERARREGEQRLDDVDAEEQRDRAAPPPSRSRWR